VAHAKGMHPGTVWRKTDLQCHSPRDRDWRGTTVLPGGDQVDERARYVWAAAYIDACKARGLSMAAITDHHDSCLAEYVRQVAAGDDGFLFFPGIEITCSDNAQCLLILDPACGPELQAKALGTLTNVLAATAEETKTCVTTPIRETMAAFYEKILNDDVLRECCLVLPHFSNPDHSHKSLNEVGHAHRFATLGCDGVYIEMPVAGLDPGTWQKIRGEVAEWGKRRRALIPTGDNRSDGWERLGVHDCWIKIGEPTIEGLRQSLLADEARIAHSQPTEPADRLVSLTVKSSLCGPAPLTIGFNPGFNAIIGGRGSGKSAILEYLRFGLARTANDVASGESGSPKERSASLIEDTLADEGFVEIRLEREGIGETWRRELRTREKITVTDAAGTTTTLTLTDAQQKFPARAFAQKGLSSTMVDNNSAAEQITGIAAAEEVEQRRQIDQDIVTAKRSVTLALQQLAAFWQLKLDAQRKAAVTHDTQIRANTVAEKLKTEGVSAEAIAIIDQAPVYSSGATYIQALENGISSTKADFAKLSPRLLAGADDQPQPTDLPLITELKTRSRDTRLRIQQIIQEGLAELERLEATKDTAKTAFGAERQAYQDKYDAAVIEQQKHKDIIDENARLTGALEMAKTAQQTAERAAAEASSAGQTLEAARSTLADCLARRRDILSSAAAKVANHSSQTLKARTKVDPAPEEYVSALAALLQGSRVSDAADKCRQWVTEALAADQAGAWRSICDQIVAIYEEKIMAGSPPEPGQALSDKINALMLGGGVLTANAANRVYQSLSDDTVGNVLAARPRDFIVLTYVDANGRSIPFDKASEGQQASALLELLLRQSAGTLVIDQPEDDLDNNVVMRIVELIRTSKSHRQLVFATHNPNIVVNGDADKILALASTQIDPRPGTDDARVAIDTDGAIETPGVKAAITHIMEGGEKAFDLRRRKYRFGAGGSRP
jgi:chromosome segregation protein